MSEPIWNQKHIRYSYFKTKVCCLGPITGLAIIGLVLPLWRYNKTNND